MKKVFLTTCLYSLCSFASANADDRVEQDNVLTSSQRIQNENAKDRGNDMRLGSFVVRPSIAVAAEFNDNVFATENNEEEDIAYVFSPGISLTSDWSNHQVFLGLNSQIGKYTDNDSEDYEDISLFIGGKVDITRDFNVDARVNYKQSHEERNSINDLNAFKPTEFDSLETSIGSNFNSGRFQYRISQSFEKLAYDNNRGIGGIIDNSTRDRDVFRTTAKVGYEIIPNYSAFVQGRYELVEYDRQDIVNRDSDRMAINIGTDISITGKVKGSIFAGYSTTEYDNSVFNDIDIFDFGANLIWSITPKTSLELKANRSVEETIEVTSPGVKQLTTSLSAEHEVRDDIVVNAGLGYTQEDFDGGVGFQREDDTISFSLGSKYYLTRDTTIGLEYKFIEKESNVSIEEYTNNIFLINSQIRF